MADSVSLLESRGQRPVAITKQSQQQAVPHVSPPKSSSTGGASKLEFFEMPGLKSLVRNGGGRRSSTSETPAVPLVRRDASCGNIVRATASLASLKKCEPVSRLIQF